MVGQIESKILAEIISHNMTKYVRRLILKYFSSRNKDLTMKAFSLM